MTQELPHPVVEALVTPAHERDARARRELADLALIEEAPLRRQQDGVGRAARGGDGVERRGYGLRAQDHPWPPAARRVVDAAMLAGGKVPRVGALDAQQPGGERPAEQAGLQEPIEHLGKERDQLEGDLRLGGHHPRGILLRSLSHRGAS